MALLNRLMEEDQNCNHELIDSLLTLDYLRGQVNNTFLADYSEKLIA